MRASRRRTRSIARWQSKNSGRGSDSARCSSIWVS
jgi:hypothetical protein